MAASRSGPTPRRAALQSLASPSRNPFMASSTISCTSLRAKRRPRSQCHPAISSFVITDMAASGSVASFCLSLRRSGIRFAKKRDNVAAHDAGSLVLAGLGLSPVASPLALDPIYPRAPDNVVQPATRRGEGDYLMKGVPLVVDGIARDLAHKPVSGNDAGKFHEGEHRVIRGRRFEQPFPDGFLHRSASVGRGMSAHIDVSSLRKTRTAPSPP